MTDQRHLERVLDSFFADGTDVLADRVFDAALDEIDHTDQRHGRRPAWKFPTTTVSPRLATAAALGVLAVVAVAFLLRPSGDSSVVAPVPSTAPPVASPVPTSTPEPSLMPSPEPTQSPTSQGGIDLCPATITTSDVSCVTDGRTYTSGGDDGFLPGLSFEAPAGLKLSAQAANLLRFSAVDRPANQEILFVRDPVPARPDGRPVTGVANTPTAFADWFAANDAYVVSPREQIAIGTSNVATTFTTVVAATGSNDDPYCLGQNHEGMIGRPYASVCKYVVQPRGWDRPMSFGTTTILRWYLIATGPDTDPGMLAVMVHGDVLMLVDGDVDDPAVALAGAERLAGPILDTLEVPRR